MSSNDDINRKWYFVNVGMIGDKVSSSYGGNVVKVEVKLLVLIKNCSMEGFRLFWIILVVFGSIVIGMEEISLSYLVILFVFLFGIICFISVFGLVVF